MVLEVLQKTIKLCTLTRVLCNWLFSGLCSSPLYAGSSWNRLQNLHALRLTSTFFSLPGLLPGGLLLTDQAFAKGHPLRGGSSALHSIASCSLPLEHLLQPALQLVFIFVTV